MKTLIGAIIGLALAFQPAVAGDAPVIKVHNYTFTTPLGWTITARPAGKYRGRFAIGRGRATAELTFSEYGFGGGSAEGDAEFWFSEFSGKGATRYLQSEQVGSVTITYVRTQGTFTPDAAEESAESRVPKSGYALCAAILESDNGLAYVKLVGPLETVREATPAFNSMVSEAARNAATKKPFLQKK